MDAVNAQLSIKQCLQASVVAAMRAQDKPRLAVLRLIQAGIKQQEIDRRGTQTEADPDLGLNDSQCLDLLDKMQKQRRESIQQFQIAKRQDLIDQESYEMSVIQEFLPPPLDAVALQQLVIQSIASTGAVSMRDMAKVMAQLKPQVQGRADMAQVGQMIKDQLTS